jgi:hypothetical protein
LSPVWDSFVALVPHIDEGSTASRSLASLGSWKLGVGRLAPAEGATLAATLEASLGAADGGAAAWLAGPDGAALADPPHAPTIAATAIPTMTRRPIPALIGLLLRAPALRRAGLRS